MGGVVEACCLQPIDVIKTRLQLDHVGRYKGEKNRIEKFFPLSSNSFDLDLDLLNLDSPPPQKNKKIC